MVEKTHALFNADDSDVTIESADGVQFRLHRKNLETNTGVFPGAEFDTRGEITHLTEPASVLEVVFQFVYPRKQPRLKDLNFDILIQVAEAVEKYEVFCAMCACEMRLGDFVGEHPLEILIHGVKHYDNHNEAQFINESALLLARSPFNDILKAFAGTLHVGVILAWARYTDAWNSVFKELRSVIDSMDHFEYCRGSYCCSNCRECLTIWVLDLQDAPSVDALQEALANSKQHPNPSYYRCQNCPGNNCRNRQKLIDVCRSEIAKIPVFTTFLAEKANEGEGKE